MGIIIAVICSNWVGEAIHSDGIYETDLEADGSVIFLRPSPPPGLNTKKAIDIACKAVWCVSAVSDPMKFQIAYNFPNCPKENAMFGVPYIAVVRRCPMFPRAWSVNCSWVLGVTALPRHTLNALLSSSAGSSVLHSCIAGRSGR